MERKGLRVNAGKTKIMICGTDFYGMVLSSRMFQQCHKASAGLASGWKY
jgi:hypothetical protein